MHGIQEWLICLLMLSNYFVQSVTSRMLRHFGSSSKRNERLQSLSSRIELATSTPLSPVSPVIELIETQSCSMQRRNISLTCIALLTTHCRNG